MQPVKEAMGTSSIVIVAAEDPTACSWLAMGQLQAAIKCLLPHRPCPPWLGADGGYVPCTELNGPCRKDAPPAPHQATSHGTPGYEGLGSAAWSHPERVRTGFMYNINPYIVCPHEARVTTYLKVNLVQASEKARGEGKKPECVLPR